MSKEKASEIIAQSMKACVEGYMSDIADKLADVWLSGYKAAMEVYGIDDDIKDEPPVKY